MKDLYELFNLEQFSSYDSVKQKYRELVIKYHPDKNHQDSDNEKYHLLTEAWNVLRDKDSKREYDDSLQRHLTEISSMTFNEEVELDEMGFDEDEESFYHDCRCGGLYLLAKSEISREQSVVVGCDTCSLQILVLHDPS